MDHIIRPMQDQDWDSVRSIYLQGIQTGDATFETTPPEWETWDGAHLPGLRLVAQGSERLLGWAALSPVSSRCVYGGVVEVSVYISASARGHGVGKTLLSALIEAAEAAGIWTLQAGIFPENRASLALHRSCGFRRVGVRERLGQLKGEWRDVILMERRSRVIGV